MYNEYKYNPFDATEKTSSWVPPLTSWVKTCLMCFWSSSLNSDQTRYFGSEGQQKCPERISPSVLERRSDWSASSFTSIHQRDTSLSINSLEMIHSTLLMCVYICMCLFAPIGGYSLYFLHICISVYDCLCDWHIAPCRTRRMLQADGQTEPSDWELMRQKQRRRPFKYSLSMAALSLSSFLIPSASPSTSALPLPLLFHNYTPPHTLVAIVTGRDRVSL